VESWKFKGGVQLFFKKVSQRKKETAKKERESRAKGEGLTLHPKKFRWEG